MRDMKTKQGPARGFKLTLAYDGTDFKGWQRLAGESRGPRTVQDCVEKCLTRLLGEAIVICGAGRTDSGVHAEGQVASFACVTPAAAEKIKRELNAILPRDIACLECEEVSPRFHARYAATGKTYRYRVLNRDEPDPFLRRYSFHVREPLDLGSMRGAAAVFVGTHDFSAFTNLKAKDKSFERNLGSITVERNDDLVDMVFHGDGFLHNQVRIMSQALIDCGLGKLDADGLRALLAARVRAQAPAAAGAFGLCLLSVDYPSESGTLSAAPA
jgi:tRNA pseudouridine38-40 synthase